MPEHGMEYDTYSTLRARQASSKHPERYMLGKRHPDRARQFKSFAALRGYEKLVEEVMAKADEPHDFFEAEDPC